MQAAVEGDAEAWEELVDDYGERPWGVARSMGLSVHDASTVAETVWLRLADRLGRGRQPGQLSLWLTTTAYIESQRLIRVSRAQVPDDPAALTDLNVASRADESARGERLYAAYMALPARCRLLLRLLSGEPRIRYRHVSQAIDLPIGSIGPTRQRCLTTLLRRYTHAGQDGPRPEARGAALDRLSADLASALALIDGVPPAVSSAARSAHFERLDRADTAEVVFDSAVDAGPTPDFGDAPGTRIVVLRSHGTSVVLRVMPDPIAGLKGMVVGPGAVAVSQRAPGRVRVPVSETATTDFSIQWASRGVFSLVLTPTTSPGPVIVTDWLVLHPFAAQASSNRR